METELDVGGDPLLERIEPQLLEPSDLSLRELLARQVGERRTPPERRAPSAATPPARRPGRPCAPGEERLEADGVDRVGLGGEDVAGSARLDDVGAERPPQLRDGVLEGGRRGLRRALTPDQVDEPVGGDDLTVVDEERREEGALPLPAELDGQPSSRTSSGPRILNSRMQPHPAPAPGRCQRWNR